MGPGLRRGGRSRRRALGPRVAHGQDLPEMAVGVLPVYAPAAEPLVDPHVGRAARRAAVRDPAPLKTPEDRVERHVGHAEAVVMALEALARGEVEGQTRVDEDRGEGALRSRPRHVEEPGEKRRARDLVASRHDNVVELDAHRAPPTSSIPFRTRITPSHRSWAPTKTTRPRSVSPASRAR